MMTRSLAVLAAVLAACGGDDPGGNPDAPTGTPDAGGAPPEWRVGRAGQVALVENWGAYIALYDRGYEQPVPVQVAAAGECAVYRRPVPSCPAGCGSEICVADDTCAPGARFASAGDITITGLTQPATFTPTEFGYTGPILPADLFADGAAIHVEADGDTLAAFTADVTGVAPLVHAIPNDMVALEDGVDETIAWTPAGGDARIQLALYLGWHGTPWTDLLICEGPDDGELVIPAALIAEMPYFEGGLFQWPSWLWRFERAWVTTTAGDVEIVAAHQATLGLAHSP